MQDDWKVSRGSRHCFECNLEFDGEQTFFSALREEGPGFVRLDYCPACWERAAAEEFFGFWKTRRQEGGRRPRMDLEVVLDLFDKLKGTECADRVEMRFVLALYLARRKALKLMGVQRDGVREELQFKRPRCDELIPVQNPHMDEGQISAATERLKELFQAEL